jgi:chromosome segregation ATPase
MTDLDEIKRLLRELEQQKEARAAEIQDFIDKVTALREEIAGLEERKGTLSAEAKETETARLAQLDQLEKECRQKLDEAERVRGQAQKELEKNREESIQAVAGIEDTKRNLLLFEEQLKQKDERLGRDRNALREKEDQLVKDCADLKDKKEALAKQMEAVQKANAASMAMKKEAEELIEAAKEMICVADGKRDALVALVESQASIRAETERRKKDAEERIAKAQDLQTAIAEREADLVKRELDLKSLLDGINQSQAMIQKREEELSILKVGVDRDRREVEQRIKYMEKLMQDIEKLK